MRRGTLWQSSSRSPFSLAPHEPTRFLLLPFTLPFQGLLGYLFAFPRLGPLAECGLGSVTAVPRRGIRAAPRRNQCGGHPLPPCPRGFPGGAWRPPCGGRPSAGICLRRVLLRSVPALYRRGIRLPPVSVPVQSAQTTFRGGRGLPNPRLWRSWREGGGGRGGLDPAASASRPLPAIVRMAPPFGTGIPARHGTEVPVRPRLLASFSTLRFPTEAATIH